jgi:hypothetical protein
MKKTIVKQATEQVAVCDFCLPEKETKTEEECVVCGRDVCGEHSYESSWGVRLCRAHIDTPKLVLRNMFDNLEGLVDWVCSVAVENGDKHGILRLLEQRAGIGKRNFAVIINGEEDRAGVIFADTVEDAMDIADETGSDTDKWVVGILEFKENRWERIRPSRVKTY